MNGVTCGLLLFLWRQYYITKFLSEHYNDLHKDPNARFICAMVFDWLADYYFKEVRPQRKGEEARLEVKFKENIEEEPEKPSVQSVTDEEDTAALNASSEDESRSSKANSKEKSKKRKKDLVESDHLSDDDSKSLSDMLGREISNDDMKKIFKFYEEKNKTAKKPTLKKQKASGRKAAGVTHPELPGGRETRSMNRSSVKK